MSNLEKNYEDLIKCLTKNIKDANELSYAKEKLTNLVVNYSNMIANNSQLEKKIEGIELNLKDMRNRIENIENDIYVDMDSESSENYIDQMHDNDNQFEFEIVCPYCEHEFITDSSFKNINEIICPKCKKTIELDWDDEDECAGHCTSCGGQCCSNHEDATIEENDENYSINIQQSEEDEKNHNKDNEDEEDDDM